MRLNPAFQKGVNFSLKRDIFTVFLIFVCLRITPVFTEKGSSHIMVEQSTVCCNKRMELLQKLVYIDEHAQVL